MASIHKGLTITVSIAEKDPGSVEELLKKYNKNICRERELYHQKEPVTFFINWLNIPSELYAGKEKLPSGSLGACRHAFVSQRHWQKSIPI